MYLAHQPVYPFDFFCCLVAFREIVPYNQEQCPALQLDGREGDLHRKLCAIFLPVHPIEMMTALLLGDGYHFLRLLHRPAAVRLDHRGELCGRML